MKNILESIDNLLLEEISKFNTLERVFRYGPLQTAKLAIWRTFNAEVLGSFEGLTTKLSNAIDYFKNNTNSNPELYINVTDLGEFANKAKLESNGDTLKAIYNNLSYVTLAICKSYIDCNTEIKGMKNIKSFNALVMLTTKNKVQDNIIKDIYTEFTKVISNKTTNIMSLSELKRQYIDSKFISSITKKIDNQIEEHISDSSVMMISKKTR